MKSSRQSKVSWWRNESGCVAITVWLFQHMRTLALVSFVPFLLLACADGDGGREPPSSDMGTGPITGTLSYRERILLSPQAQVEVRLLDVSIADMPAKTLSMARIDDPGPPPIDFRLEFDPANIDERHSYVVRAEIREGDRLLFTTDKAYPVLTRGAGNTADLLLVAVDHSPEPAVPLFETHWKLISIGDKLVVTKPPPEDAHLVLVAKELKVSGYSGCNRFSGGFELDGERLEFGVLASTRRACIDTMELEASYLAALGRVDRFEIVQQELRLHAGPELVARFVAVEPVVL